MPRGARADRKPDGDQVGQAQQDGDRIPNRRFEIHGESLEVGGRTQRTVTRYVSWHEVHPPLNRASRTSTVSLRACGPWVRRTAAVTLSNSLWVRSAGSFHPGGSNSSSAGSAAAALPAGASAAINASVYPPAAAARHPARPPGGCAA